MAATFGERVQSVEKALDKQSEMMDTFYKQVQGAFDVQRSFMDALVEALKAKIPDFQTALEDAAKAVERARLKAKQDQQKAQIEHLVKGGMLALSEVVTEKSLVIAEVTNAEKELVSERAAFSLDADNVPEWLKKEFVGKKVGDSITAPSGEVLLVIEVYDPSTPAPVEVTDSQEAK